MSGRSLAEVLAEIETRRGPGTHGASNDARDVAVAAKAFGLSAAPGVEITRDEAARLLEHILGADLAYGAPTDLFDDSVRLTAELFGLLPEAARYFTNGLDPRRRQGGWTPSTQATFDTGIVASHAEGSVCVWVEDED